MFAYMSILTNKSYGRGLKNLAKSLKTTKTDKEFYVVIPSDKQEVLSEEECRKYDIKVLYVDRIPDLPNQADTSYWKDTLFKLTVFSLTQFEKIIFLDSDMIVLKNLDHLFEAPSCSAVAAGAVLHSDWKKPNSGLMVIRPSLEDYKSLIGCISKAYQRRKEQNLPFGDQDVLDEWLPDWADQDALHLPETYNCMLGYADLLKANGIVKSKQDIYVYHFTGREKPWRGWKERLVILLKIIKRSRHLFHSIDLKIYSDYKSLMSEE